MKRGNNSDCQENIITKLWRFERTLVNTFVNFKPTSSNNCIGKLDTSEITQVILKTCKQKYRGAQANMLVYWFICCIYTIEILPMSIHDKNIETHIKACINI